MFWETYVRIKVKYDYKSVTLKSELTLTIQDEQEQSKRWEVDQLMLYPQTFLSQNISHTLLITKHFSKEKGVTSTSSEINQNWVFSFYKSNQPIINLIISVSKYQIGTRVSKTDTEPKTTVTDIDFANYPGYTDIRVDGYLAIIQQ